MELISSGADKRVRESTRLFPFWVPVFPHLYASQKSLLPVFNPCLVSPLTKSGLRLNVLVDFYGNFFVLLVLTSGRDMNSL
jgi:hypothetical protein